MRIVSRVYSEWDCPPFPDLVVGALNKLWHVEVGSSFHQRMSFKAWLVEENISSVV